MPRASKKTKVNDAVDGKTGEVKEEAVPARKHVRGRKGALQDLPNLPLDLLFEIFACLRPMDLLNLARTAKSFRQVLMSKSSRLIWRESISSLEGFPAYPTDIGYLDEPGYVNLAFDPHCHECLTKNAKTMIWEFRARYCGKCYKAAVKRTNQLFTPAQHSNKRLTPCHVTQRGRYGVDRYYLTSDLLSFGEAAKVAKAISADASKAMREKYIANTAAIMEHSKLCKAWYKANTHRRAEELKGVKGSRVDQIIAHLVDLGWEDELDRMSSPVDRLCTLPVVKKPSALTDKVWQNMSATVIAFMESEKATRLQLEWDEIILKRFTSVRSAMDEVFISTPPTERLPTTVDILASSTMRAILDVPLDQQGTGDAFEDTITAKLPEIIVQWKVDTEAKFQQHLILLTGNEVSPDFSTLATTAFYTDGNPKVAQYPSVLAQRPVCAPSRKYQFVDADEDEPEKRGGYDRMLEETYYQLPWSCDIVKLVPLEDTKRVISACGGCPETDTISTMDARDARISRVGVGSVGLRTVYGWRTALESIQPPMAGSKSQWQGEWELATPQETKIVKAFEIENSEAHFATRAIWDCRFCRKSNETKRMLGFHLLSEHGLDEVADSHVSRDLGDADAAFGPVLLTPKFTTDPTLRGQERVASLNRTFCHFPQGP